jgi:hypothetical protein
LSFFIGATALNAIPNGNVATATAVLWCVELHFDRENGMRRVQRTQMKVTRELAPRKEQHEREHK